MTPETPAQTIARLEKHVASLSAGRQLLCGFCGHVYGDSYPRDMAEALKRHIAKCPTHPMHQVLKTLKAARELVSNALNGSATVVVSVAQRWHAWLDLADAAIAAAEFVPGKKAARKKK